VEANRIALEGVSEEEKVGQRTTLDVLNAQLEYLTSQIGLVTAERDRLVAEYSLYAAVGRLDAQSLGLSVPYYDPIEHYDTVKNKWFGLRPPSPPAYRDAAWERRCCLPRSLPCLCARESGAPASIVG
jgi:outer membrane protein